MDLLQDMHTRTIQLTLPSNRQTTRFIRNGWETGRRLNAFAFTRTACSYSLVVIVYVHTFTLAAAVWDSLASTSAC